MRLQYSSYYMKHYMIILLISLVVTPTTTMAQTQGQRTLSLSEAIAIARTKSVDASVALNELRTAYWEYRTYKANLLPELNFTASLPSYYKQYSPYLNAEGSYSFVRTNYLEMSGELSVTQKIWATGGTLSLNTSIDFLRQLEVPKYNRFMSIPVAMTLNQPLFSVNTAKWDRKIEPVRYAEAKAAFLSATEEVAMMAITRYFNLLMAMETQNIAKQNLSNAEKLYEVAKEKRAIGQISKNDLLQMELNLLNARSKMTDADSEHKSMMFQLKAFLDIDDATDIIPEVPEVPHTRHVAYDDALNKALANNEFSLNIRRRQLQADYQVAQAKGNLREISLFAQIGFTGMDTELCDAYNPLKDNQVVEIGLKIPLVDWGKRRGKVKVAESNRKLTQERIRQERQNFSQDIFILVERFNNQLSQVNLAMRADTITQQRYDTNVETYLIGRISTLDLNDSQVSKDEARQTFVNELYQYWYFLYQLRSLTLWDYVENKGIEAEIELILSQN